MKLIPEEQVEKPVWLVVTEPERDMPTKECFDANPTLYMVIGTKGGTTLSYPVYRTDGKFAYWRSVTNHKGLTYPDATYAYAPACIPAPVLEHALASANRDANIRVVYEGRTRPTFAW